MGRHPSSYTIGVVPAQQIVKVETTIRDYLGYSGGDVEIRIA